MPPRPAFWMIARRPTGPGSVTAPTQRYGTRDDAIRAAQALADRTGHDFILLEATEIFRPGTANPTLF